MNVYDYMEKYYVKRPRYYAKALEHLKIITFIKYISLYRVVIYE